jgi:hypothetical protein
MPQSISVNNEIFADYLKVASLPNKERKELFSKQTNEQKANFIKVNLALQIVKRPNLTKDQKEFILDGLSKVSADIYDRSSPEKIEQSNQLDLEIEAKSLGLFEHKDLGDFIEPLMMSKDTEVRLLQKYENLLKSGMKSRRLLARQMIVSDRVNIWKTQLAYHLATGNFSKQQREFILDFLVSISDKTFAPKNLSREEEAKELEKLDNSIQTYFSKSEAFAIFEEIGIHKIINDPVEPPNTRLDWCDCRWYCSGNNTCSTGRCNSDIQNCGPTGTWYCYYQCKPNKSEEAEIVIQ